METTTQQTNGTAAQPTPNPNAAALATIEISKSGEIVKVGYDTFQGFLALQRVGGMFSASSVVPDQYRAGPKVSAQQALANCCIAVNMAIRLGADPLMVMQNGYIVHNKWGWSAQFLIATFNQCGRFAPVRYRSVGKLGDDSYGLIAWTRELENSKSVGDPIEGPAVTIAMAKAEGWHGSNPKWRNMTDLMLRYRSAAFLIKTTAPEIAMGLQTVEELEDIGGSAETFTAPPSPAALPAATSTQPVPAPAEATPAETPSPNAPPAQIADTLDAAREQLRLVTQGQQPTEKKE